MAEHAFREWVHCPVFEQIITTLLNMHPDCVFNLQYLSWSDPLMRMAGHASRKWVHSWVFEKIRATDENGGTCIQNVSLLSRFFFWVDQNHWLWLNIHPGCEFALQCLSGSKPLTRVWTCIQRVSHSQNHWWEWLNTHPGSEFALQCLSRLEPLMRMAEHTSRKWVYSPVFDQSKITDKNGWKHNQQVSCSPLFKQIRNTNMGWMLIDWQQVSCSHVWDQNYWWELLNTHPASESHLCLCRSESLTGMADYI